MAKKAGLNLLAAGGLLVLTFASLLIQPLLPLAVLAFLYILPGYILIKLLRVEADALLTLALSLLLSAMVSAHAIYWLSMLFGYGSGAFYLFFVIVSLAALFVREPPDIIGKGFQAPAALALITMLVIFYVLYSSMWVPTEHGVITGGWNYSDIFQHLAIVQTVNNGNFPPQEPMFAGAPLRYHWFIDLHTAIAAKLLAVFPAAVMVFEHTLYTGVLSMLAFLLAFHFTKNRNASLIAALLVVFGGGFGYMNLWNDLRTAPLPQLLASKSYDNDWGFFQVPSVLGGYLLVQRPQIIGIPAVAAVMLLVASGYPRDWRRLLLAGLITGMLPPFQTHAFIASVAISLTYVAYYHAAKFASAIAASRRTAYLQEARRSLLHAEYAALLFLPILISVPFLLGASERTSSLGLGLGWIAPKDLVQFALFYAGNFGLPFLLAIAGFFLAPPKERWPLAIWMLLLFAIPNLINLTATQWDMAKFFTYMWLPVSIFAGVLISRIPQSFWVVILFFCMLSPVTILFYFLTSNSIGLSASELAAGDWIAANTPQLSVFITGTQHNSPVESVGGRMRIIGYLGWLNNYGLNYSPRVGDIRTIYCGPPDAAASAMRKYDARYIYVSGNERGEFRCGMPFTQSPLFKEEFKRGEAAIYSLR